MNFVSLENNSHVTEDTKHLWQPHKAAVSCPGSQHLVLRVSLSTQRQHRLELRYQAPWEGGGVFCIEEFHCCQDARPGQVPPQQPTSTPPCF